MVIVLILAVLAIVGSVGTVIATLRDARGRVPEISAYDSRNPVL